ncbi:MAG: hypothetical protein ABJE47_02340 [bacterium]
MNNNRNGAEFNALTDDEQTKVVGGEGSGDLAYALGWLWGYSVECTKQALILDYKFITGQL